MKYTKPAWVIHKDASSKDDTNPKRLPIFSVHVHPDGSRIATGGLDARVRIWSTRPILSAAAAESGRPPKQLCTLAMHTGPVLCVRWAHSGRWLASGSDDEVVMIWDLDPHAKGKVWGSDEVNVEGWKPLKRLPGHESDVTDLAWSPEDRYLASVGLDSKVIIWDGYTLERIRKLDQHQGFVKGVCWDPVGEYLATQSDDRSVKIWRTTDWTIEAEVRKPFEDSPGSTFFRRLSWSPDGAHITASNATNNQGFVFIAAVIARNSWTSEISLVGHENTVEVASYNPHIFLRNPSLPVQTSNICSVVALGADDRSVSVWQTKSARPVVVVKDAFERQILDLSWSWDGLTLYAVSSDGTLAALAFTPDEMEGLAPASAQEQYLQKFGFVPPPLPAGYSHTAAPAAVDTPAAPNAATATATTNGAGTGGAATNGTGIATTNGTGEVVNMLVAKRGKGNKNRRPRMDDVPSAGSGSALASGSGSGSGLTARVPPPVDPSPFAAPFSTHRPLHEDVVMDDVPSFGGFDLPGPSVGASATTGPSSSVAAGQDEKPPRGRTLGGERAREAPPAVVREITNTAAGAQAPLAPTGALFDAPRALTFLCARNADGAEEVVEARNAEAGGDVNEVVYLAGKTTLWLDYLPSPAVALAATGAFCAVGALDGTLHVYSPAGRRLLPTLTLDAPAMLLAGCKAALVALTAAGTLYSWNTKKGTANFPPVSVRPILAVPIPTLIPTPAPDAPIPAPISIVTLHARANGAPVLVTSAGHAHAYDGELLAFVRLADAWHARGSDAWPARARAPRPGSVVAGLEGAVAEQVQTQTPNGQTQAADVARPEWWSAAMTLGHLEGRVHAARVLESGAELKSALLVYAKKLADEGFRSMADELVRELFGPVYWRPSLGAGRDEVWCPSLAGHAKRDLLKEVLQIFARSKTLTKMALDWQDMLRKASAAVDD